MNVKKLHNCTIKITSTFCSKEEFFLLLGGKNSEILEAKIRQKQQKYNTSLARD